MARKTKVTWEQQKVYDKRLRDKYEALGLTRKYVWVPKWRLGDLQKLIAGWKQEAAQKQELEKQQH